MAISTAYYGPRTAEQCLQACLLDLTCAAVDFNNKETDTGIGVAYCYISTNAVTLLKPNTAYDHYVINRICRA